MDHWLILLLALILDAFIGDPDWLWRRVPHPVVAFGKMIECVDKRLNDNADARMLERRGFVAIIGLVALVVIAGMAVSMVLDELGMFGGLLEVIIIAVFLAQRSLSDHVVRVAHALERKGLVAGRNAVAMIVGRDVSQLDESGVSRAAIESLAENFSDGVVAPTFWYALLGLPGLFAYKLVNTADSMVGHMNERYRHFGCASAKLDDVLNWVPARISAILIALSRPVGFAQSLTLVRTDAPRHRSVNAGWPEAAMAATSGSALGGPRAYGPDTLSEPILNSAGRRVVTSKDILTCVSIFWAACVLQWVAVGLIAIV